MKINHIQFQDWSMESGAQGVQLIYGPNESGKTTLLRGLRNILFGPDVDGAVTVERDGHEYYIGRKGKDLQFYKVGGPTFTEEPSQLWWQGLDKNTYSRIFGLTLEDMQGTSIVQEVNVRTRFFGAEGGASLRSVLQDIEEASRELLVASANGRRKINVLAQQWKDHQQKKHQLEQSEAQYVRWQLDLDNTVVREEELQEQLKERRHYGDSIEVVLRAWDTYTRAEEAREQLQKYGNAPTLEREAFLALDQDLTQCRDYMRIWKGKEDGLMPENFSPVSPLGTYGGDIENLYQQVAQWTQWQKDVAEGRQYLDSLDEQIQMSRRMHTAWRSDEEMAEDVDWHQGERLSRALREAREAKERHDNEQPTGDTETAKPAIPTAPTVDAATKERAQQALDNHKPLSPVRWILGGVVLALGFAVAIAMPAYVVAGIALVMVGLGCLGWAYQGRRQWQQVHAQLEQAVADASVATTVEPTSEQLAQLYAYQQDKAVATWNEQAQQLQQEYDAALVAWRRWLPAGAGRTLMDEDFFGMKQEYDHYQAQRKQWKDLYKRWAAHKEQLDALEDKARWLWEQVGKEDPVTPVELRRLYNQYQHFQQNKVRWEQKEGQRKNYREEYDQWRRKEKELLLQQQELITKSGLSSASEYRQMLLQEDQKRQWETIYKQSQIQLKLLAPTAENEDLFYRRLRNGKKEKWEAELAHSNEEIRHLEQQLAAVYEKRGEIVQAMRQLAENGTYSSVLQEGAHIEAQLEEAIENWVVQVLIHRAMEEAQERYEKNTQPTMLALASDYLSRLTGETYTVTTASDGHIVPWKNDAPLDDPSQWSSGFGDQLYLALRLSLCAVYADQVENMPIILDDVFVRFDEERQQRALSLLAHIGETQQVWVFTCHNSLCRLGKAQAGIDTYTLTPTGVVAV